MKPSCRPSRSSGLTLEQGGTNRLKRGIQGGPQKVSHYHESSLNRTKNRQCGHISHQF